MNTRARRAPRPTARGDRGLALVAVLSWLSLLAVLALGAALATSAEAPATGAVHDRVRLVRAAESAVSLAVAALARETSWTTVPEAGVASGVVDGAAGVRTVGGAAIDLLAETWWRTCGRRAACDELATATSDARRPWGLSNPRWRLIVHTPLAAVDDAAGAVCPCYVAAWVADDPADADGDPRRDAPFGVAGHGVLLVRGVAWAGPGAVAEVEALVAQPCRKTSAACAGSLVQSWGVVGPPAP